MTLDVRGHAWRVGVCLHPLVVRQCGTGTWLEDRDQDRDDRDEADHHPRQHRIAAHERAAVEGLALGGEVIDLAGAGADRRAQPIDPLVQVGELGAIDPVEVDERAEGDQPALDLAVGALQLAVLAPELGVERWVVCGQSFGAGLATQYALEKPERVMGLIITNSISAFSPKGDPERAATQAERARTIEAGGKKALEELRIHPRHAKRFPEDIKAEMVADADRIAPEGILRSIALTSPSLSIADRLGEIRVPTLLVNGIWEKRFQPMRERAASLIPGVTVVDLPAGHSVNIEAAEGFDQAVAAFVGRLRA